MVLDSLFDHWYTSDYILGVLMKNGSLFMAGPLVFNGKTGYLNSPKHRSVHSWHFSCRLFENLQLKKGETDDHARNH